MGGGLWDAPPPPNLWYLILLKTPYCDPMIWVHQQHFRSLCLDTIARGIGRRGPLPRPMTKMVAPPLRVALPPICGCASSSYPPQLLALPWF